MNAYSSIASACGTALPVLRTEPASGLGHTAGIPDADIRIQLATTQAALFTAAAFLSDAADILDHEKYPLLAKSYRREAEWARSIAEGSRA